MEKSKYCWQQIIQNNIKFKLNQQIVNVDIYSLAAYLKKALRKTDLSENISKKQAKNLKWKS